MIKWKTNILKDTNDDRDEEYDYLSEAIKDSRSQKIQDLSICDDREEIDTIYSELDQSMAQK